MECGGALTVTAEIVDYRARLTVADTGGGIPEAMRERNGLPSRGRRGTA